MHSVMCGIHTCFLGITCNTELVLASTALSGDTRLKIALGVTQDIPQQFGKSRSMVCLLKGITFESLSHLRIPFTVGLTAHGKIHAHFATLSIEVIDQVFDHLLVSTLFASSTKFVNRSERLFLALYDLIEL